MTKLDATKATYNPGLNVPWTVEGETMDGRSQPGWETQHITDRGTRSFEFQRESQVMRHMSRQLFPHLNAAKAKPIEIQMMWANDSLFIGTNKDTPTKKLKDVITNSKELEQALAKVWGQGGETHERTKRSVAKLKRLREWDPGDVDEESLDVYEFADMLSRYAAKTIFDLLRTPKKAMELYCTDEKEAKGALGVTGVNQLYFVREGNNKGRHIEEKFIDLLELARYRQRAIVAGVKRPCGTCWIRLTKAVEKGLSGLEFSPYPGNIWKAQAETLGIESREIKHYVRKGTHRSFPGGKDYDSGSDTEGEEDML